MPFRSARSGPGGVSAGPVRQRLAALVLFLLAGLALLLVPVPVRADQTRPAAAPVPVAQPVQASAVKGIPVDITLKCITASTRTVEFVIRQQPKHGRLEGPPVQAGKDSAVVRYIAEAGAPVSLDGFTYAARLVGVGSSGEAAVTVRLADPAPVVIAPGGLDLGRVIANEVNEHPLRVENRGNAPFRAEVPLPEGWAWVHPAGGRFEVAPGDAVEAVLRIRVLRDGPLDHKLELHPGTVVRVIGRALPPILGYPSLLRLQWERGTSSRSYRFSIRNNRGQPALVALTAPSGVVLPASVEIPPAESREVTVACDGDLEQALRGKIGLEVPGWRQEIDFEAPPAPALVELSGADGGPSGGTLDFGVLEKPDSPEVARSLKLRNAGGTAALVRWDPLRFFLLEGMEPEFMLNPRAEREFKIRPRPDEPGRLKEELELRMTGGDRKLTLTAEISADAARAAMVSGPALDVKPQGKSNPEEAPPRWMAPKSEEIQKLNIQIFNRGLMEKIPNQDDQLPVVSVVRFLEEESGPEKLAFEWDAPAEGAWTYRVMVRMLRLHAPGQPPIPEYDQMDNVKVMNTPSGGGKAVVTRMRPGARWVCCIVAIRSDGVATKPSRDLTFLVPFEKDSRWTWRIVGTLSLVALGLYIRQKWREDVKWKD